MSTTIRTHAELKSEIERLSLQKREQENLISGKIMVLSDQLKPVNLLKSFLSSLNKDKEVKNQFASMGTEAAIGFILSNVFFRKSNSLIKAIVTIAGSSFITKLIGNDTSKYFNKLKSMITKFRSDLNEETDTSFNEKDIYRDE